MKTKMAGKELNIKFENQYLRTTVSEVSEHRIRYNIDILITPNKTAAEIRT